MDALNAEDNLCQLWMLYTSKNDAALFQSYLKLFLETYQEYVDVEFSHLAEGFMAEGPHLTKLPEGLLQEITRQLADCNSACASAADGDMLEYAEALVKCLIIISRNVDNVPMLASCSYVSHLVSMATVVLSKLSSGNVEDVAPLTSFITHVLHFLECLYDPWFGWHKQLRGWKAEYSNMKQRPATLHVEVVPFLYESFQHVGLDVNVQMELLHVFGAIISGSQENALRAVCPATLDILLKALSISTTATTAPPNDTVQHTDLVTLKSLVLKCLVNVVHCLHTCSPDQRQVEVGALFEGYSHVLLALEMSPQNRALQLDMLGAIESMLECDSRAALQLIFVVEGIFDMFVTILTRITVGSEAYSLVSAVIRVITAVMSGSQAAKDLFRDRVSYTKFVDAVKSLGQPSQDLLTVLLDLVIEGRFDGGTTHPVQNPQAAIMLVKWLPDIQSHDLQTWLSESLSQLCTSGIHNRLSCCGAGMISAILSVLWRHQQINTRAVGSLITLLESLGIVSITATELRQLIQLLKPCQDNCQIPYFCRLLQAMSAMARRDGREVALHYFDFHDANSGVVVPCLKRWPGVGFTFHAWVCLDNHVPIVTQDNQLVRRQLYSFLSSAGNGFEAFITAECTLVVAVGTKKDYNTVAVVDSPLTDQNWHCIDIVHASSRRPFTQSQLCVYIDGRLRLTEQLKFPPLTEPFSHCQIASPGLKLTTDPSSVAAADEPHRSRLLIPGLSFSRLRISMSMRGMTTQSDTVHTLDAGSQDGQFGIPISLIGQISSVCVFHEALSLNHIRNMYLLGPNCLTLFQTEDANLTELSAKLVLHYNAKASKDPMCLDLSSNQNDGQLVGQTCSTYDIKDVINCIGGIQVLFPLLEQLSQHPPTPTEAMLNNGPSPSKELDCTDWVVVPSSSYADCKLEQAGVALFIVLLKNMLQGHLVNQETLVREHALATLGVIFQKVEPHAIDVSVLMALQLLVEMVAPADKQLLHHVYQFVLFDFRLWSRSDFTVRIGHIQYLSTIIKDDKKYFRKKYGVQFLLDVINAYYSCPEDSKLEEDDCRTIRSALLSLLKYYIYKCITYEELSQLLSFIFTVKHEHLMCEVVDMLLPLLETPGNSNKKQDQLVLLMYEPNMAELLYVLLADGSYPVTLKEKILKMLLLLLETDKVYEKSKSRLRLSELGLYPGLVSLMSHSPVSLYMVSYMLTQVFLTDSPASYDAALSILQLLPGASVEIKLAVTRQLLLTLFSKPNAARLFARQLGWQQIFVRLFIASSQSSQDGATRNMTSDTCDPGSPEPESARSSQSLTDPPTPVTEPSFTAGDMNLSLALLKDDTSEISGERTSQGLDLPGSPLLDRIPTFDLTTPTNLSPQFSHMAMFDDSDVFEADWPNRAGHLSRSSSASVEDINQQGAAHASCSSESATASSSNPNLMTLGSQSSELGNAETNMASGIGASQAYGAEAETASGREESLLDVLGELKRIGIKFERFGNSQDPVDELCDNLLVILFMVSWKGVDRPRVQAWKDRGQVPAAINYTSETHALFRPPVDIKRRLLELMLQGCIIDLKQAGQTNPVYTENATEVMHMIYNFLCLESDGSIGRFSERIIEDVLTLLDLLTVWDQDNEWSEMKQLGLTILLEFAAQDDIVLCSIAAARLHTLLQTHPVEKLQESCFVMAAIDDIITTALPENGEHYNFLIPVMKALVDKCGDLLNMKTYLPGLPTTHLSATFFDDFKKYIHHEEWRSFMRKQVIPSKEQYLSNSYDRIKVRVKTHLGECHEEMMINSHKRNRVKGESKLKFQADIGNAFKTRVRHERKRYLNTMTQLRSQHSSALRQWRSTKMFITGERGVWADEMAQDPQDWKLSNQENFSRMRPKLVPNYNFDLHTDASRLRDNLMVEESMEELPSLLREAKVSDEDIGDDRLEDEEWNLLSTVNTATEEASGREKLVLSESCELITMMDVIKGRLEVTTTHVYFFDCTPNKDEGGGEDFKWALSQLREIHFRRYNLRRSALELFLINQSNYFLNFQKKVRNKVYTRILSLRPANLIYYGSRSPAELLRASGLTQKWVQGEISNFEYLMQLNTIAGRTYNDLSQYPVFPWILTDYTSDTLNLDDEKVYRDLSRPLGVVNPKIEEQVREKYDHFEDPTGTVEKFHYGTHYSNAAGVMHYMIRVEPFTTLHIQLQSGRFDVADRQFHSIASTWRALMENPNDVKELIPEFFYLPEFLQNINKFDFGILQGTNVDVGDVVLPKWASSPEDFIHKHMRALESEYVSQHLHQWIDLIFGYKQKGPEAVEALNVFYYCTYEGAVDLDAVTNPTERKALEGIINNFGQTPCQLLKEPHPKRMLFEEVVAKAAKSDKPLSLLQFLNLLKAFYVEASVDHVPLAYVCVPRNQARSFIQQGMPDAMVAVTQEGLLLIHGWLPYDRSISHYFTFERDTTISTVRAKRVLAGPFAPGLKVTPHLFAVSHDAKLVFSGGHWDNSVRVYSLGKQKMVAHIVRHTDIVTCIALDTYGQHIITGSRDTTCMVWQVIYQSGMSQTLSKRPTQILYGHTDHITCVAISEELDMTASGSKDGTVIVHTMRKGIYMRTLRPMCERGLQLSVEQIVLSDVGQICLYCEQHLPLKPTKQKKLDLHLYSVNGKHLASETLLHPLSHMLITDGHLVFGSSHGTLVVKELFGLKTLSTVTLHIPITCVTVTNSNSHILAGLSDGKLIIIGIKKNSEVK